MRFSLKAPDQRFQVPLETERFILRPTTKRDLFGDPGGWRSNRRIYRDLDGRKDPLNFVTWLKIGPFPDGEWRFTYAIVPKGSGRPIGYHMIRLMNETTARNTVGIHDEAWLGKDVAVEARARLMNHFFRNGIERFASRCSATNLPSVFTYRKLGYTHFDTRPAERRDPETGKPVDVLHFEMKKADWKLSRYAEPGL